MAATLAALRFSAPTPELVYKLSEPDWDAALRFLDRAGLTLLLGAQCRDALPLRVRERIERDLANNITRTLRLRAAAAEIIQQFNARGIEYLLLKGFTHDTEYVADPYRRAGYDIDLFAPAHSLAAARETLASLGFEEIPGAGHFPADHLPPMIRKTGWQWHGDYFDPAVPPCVDLHFRFCDEATEGFPAPGAEEFWQRRVEQDGFVALSRPDRLGYASLHLLRHLFRGSLRPHPVYEIAYFLQTHGADDSFWSSWRESHPPQLRRLEAIAFRLAIAWFGCRMPAVAAEEVHQLAGGVASWFERYAAAPVEAQFHPNKHEIWLQFELLDSARSRARVFVRRMLPVHLPALAQNAFVPEQQITWRMRANSTVHYASHIAGRVWHHVLAVPPVVIHGLIWKSSAWRLPGPFWRYLSSSLLYYLGLYQFAVLYNLYMLDLGYRENVLGLVAGAFTAGNLTGVLPAAAVLNRYGLKRSLLIGVSASAIAFGVRAAMSGETALVAAAFAAGALNAIWTVAISPATAAVTPEGARPAAFSLLFGSGIALGIGAGVGAGSIARWLEHVQVVSSPLYAKQAVLIAGSACVALALIPLARLRIESPPPRETRSYPRGSFITRFLIAIGIWNFATGLFNPLFNAYFARQFSMPVARIGTVFSLAQAAQVVAILSAPLVFRKFGMARGVSAMQLATALALATLACSSAAMAAVALYAAYASLQYMSEPGIYSLLMDRVAPAERSGASALNFLVLFLAQAGAAWLSGLVVTRFGYPPMLAGAACLAAAAGITFWRLLGKPAKS